MIRFKSRFRLLKTLLVICIALQAASCGTILYPERKGQPAGPLDFKVVALDAVGLLLFFVPGVVAFAVDFNNGTIYLPPEDYGEYSSLSEMQENWTVIDVDADKLSAEHIASVIRERTGKTVSFQPGTFQVQRLEHSQQIASAMAKLQQQHSVAPPNAVLFRCQSD